MFRVTTHLARRAARVILPALLLALPAAVLVVVEAPQVRYEELAESIRGPVWLEHRLVYDPVSTNLGWYALLLGVYHLFGFTLATAKWARVALLAASLVALSLLLHRRLRPLPAIAVLAAWALSPSLLFLNRLTTSYGTDLLLLPCALLLVDEVWRRSRPRREDGPAPLAAVALPSGAGSSAAAAALGALAMVGAMTYPAFVPAVPFLGGWLIAASPPHRRRRHLAAAAAGFATPLLAGILALRDPSTLLRDPVAGGGLFRGGATGWSADPGALRANLELLARDLFDEGASYYFELRTVEFGGWLGIVGFAAVVVLALLTAWRVPEARAPLASALAAVLVAALAAAAAGGPPGLRRGTLLIAAFYAALAVVWAARDRWVVGTRARAAVAAALLLLPIHHAIAYTDHLEQARHPVWGRERVWLVEPPTPQAALEHWAARVEAGEMLDCRALLVPGKQTCRYDYIYAAIDGARRWNGKAAVAIGAIDHRDGGVVTLTPELWRTQPIPPLPSKRRRPS